jgi:hypothetical protein
VNPVLRSLRDLFTVNPGLKLVAVGLALLIQTAVQKDSIREAEVAVPLSISGVTKGQVFTGNLPDKALVRVRGRWTAIRTLLADQDLKLVVDLTSYKSGERHIFEQRSVEQQLPVESLEVVSVQPAALDVRLEALEERDVTIEPVVQGEPAPGFRALAKLAEATPGQVRISGPASSVRRVQRVRTAPVDVTGAEGDLRQTVRLLPPAERLTRLAQEEVQVHVPMQELELSKTLTGLTIAVRGCPPESRCVLDPPEAALRVEGPAKLVTGLVAEPPTALVVADLQAAIGRGNRSVRLSTVSLKGLLLTPQPVIARFVVLSEIAAPVRPEGRGPDLDDSDAATVPAPKVGPKSAVPPASSSTQPTP